MYSDMEQWIEIRRRVLNGELSKRAACSEYGIHWGRSLTPDQLAEGQQRATELFEQINANKAK